VQRKLFAPKGEEVIGGWEELHNEDPCNYNASPNIVKAITRRMMGKPVARVEE
jgi:hypothetical protein